MDSLELSERLMTLGWWNEAEKTLLRSDVMPSERTLQSAVITCRRECVSWLLSHGIESALPSGLLSRMLREFDAYTVHWVLHEYSGEGSELWRTESEKANGPTD